MSPTSKLPLAPGRRHSPHRLLSPVGPPSGGALLAAAGAAQVLGVDHGATKALARASTTMAKVDLWHARLAVKTLRRDQREAIAEVGEG